MNALPRERDESLGATVGVPEELQILWGVGSKAVHREVALEMAFAISATVGEQCRAGSAGSCFPSAQEAQKGDHSNDNTEHGNHWIQRIHNGREAPLCKEHPCEGKERGGKERIGNMARELASGQIIATRHRGNNGKKKGDGNEDAQIEATRGGEERHGAARNARNGTIHREKERKDHHRGEDCGGDAFSPREPLPCRRHQGAREEHIHRAIGEWGEKARSPTLRRCRAATDDEDDRDHQGDGDEIQPSHFLRAAYGQGGTTEREKERQTAEGCEVGEDFFRRGDHGTVHDEGRHSHDDVEDAARPAIREADLHKNETHHPHKDRRDDGSQGTAATEKEGYLLSRGETGAHHRADKKSGNSRRR